MTEDDSIFPQERIYAIAKEALKSLPAFEKELLLVSDADGHEIVMSHLDHHCFANGIHEIHELVMELYSRNRNFVPTTKLVDWLREQVLNTPDNYIERDKIIAEGELFLQKMEADIAKWGN